MVGSKPAPDVYRPGWVVASCPFAFWKHSGGTDKNPSFGVRIAPGKTSHFHCFSCNTSGDLEDMLFELKHLLKKFPLKFPTVWSEINLGTAMQVIATENADLQLDIPDWEDAPETPEEPVAFPEWWLDSFPSAEKFHEAIDYLANRGVDFKKIAHYDVRFDPVQKRVCFPFRNKKKELMGLHGRSIVPKQGYFSYGFENRRNKLVWFGEEWVNFEIPLVMVESIFDLTQTRKIWNNTVAPFSAGISKLKAKRMRDADSIITMFDAGKGGQAARKAIVKYLGKDIPIKHIYLTDELCDPGQMSTLEIYTALQMPLGLALKEKLG